MANGKPKVSADRYIRELPKYFENNSRNQPERFGQWFVNTFEPETQIGKDLANWPRAWPELFYETSTAKAMEIISNGVDFI